MAESWRFDRDDNPDIESPSEQSILEQKVIHEDCLLTRNYQQMLADEQYAKELQSQFDEELASNVARLRIFANESVDGGFWNAGTHVKEPNLLESLLPPFCSSFYRDLPTREQETTHSDSEDTEDEEELPIGLLEPSTSFEIPSQQQQRPHASPVLRRRMARQPEQDIPEDFETLTEFTERLGPARKAGLSKSDIYLLPTRNFISKTYSNSPNSETTACHICLNEWKTGDRIKSLPCFHDFHKKCITDWLTIRNSCPVCRLEVKIDVE